MSIKNMFDHTGGHTVTSNDAEIYVEEIGDSGSPVLLMLHGGFGSMEDFNTITPALSSRFRLIGVDSRGHGRSSLGTAGLSYRMLASDLAHVIDSLGLHEFSILGFSDGGITAYRYAAGQDTRLDKIVTVGASGEISEDDPSWQLFSGMTGEVWKERFPAGYELYMRLNPMPDFDHFAMAVVAMWTDLSPHGRPGALISQINNEMLIVRGDNDRLAPLENMAKLCKSAKNAHFMNIPFANHAAFDDAPDVFLRAFGTFFGMSFRDQTR